LLSWLKQVQYRLQRLRDFQQHHHVCYGDAKQECKQPVG